MDDAHDGPYAREPQIEDLARICGALNDAGARYVLVDASPENVARVKQALHQHPRREELKCPLEAS